MKGPQQQARVGRHPTTAKLWRTRLAGVIITCGATLIASLGLAASAAVSADNITTVGRALVISEVQTGGCADNEAANCSKLTNREFIELYNQTADTLDVTGWQVRYLSASGQTVTTLVSLNGNLSGHGYLLISHAGYYSEEAQLVFGLANDTGKLAESAGHIEVLDAAGVVVDRLGWGNGAVLALTKPAAYPKAGQSLFRSVASDGRLVDTANNATDFAISDTPSPHSGDYTANPPVAPESAPALTPSDAVTNSCEGVIISELLPNPAGADSGHEFIELHNPTDEVINLQGCTLQTNANSKTFALPDISLQPYEYRSISDTESGLTLSNSAGGTAWLLSADQELSAVTYPGNLGDDVSWALVDGSWAQTYTPTAGRANLLTATEPCPAGQERNFNTNRCVNASAVDDGNDDLTPCKEGQERNPETNRCRNISTTDSQLTACKAGQVRNPSTNRCVNASTAATTQAACKAGQERNPETNRCRNITSTASATKPCPAGQVRNPETNRCRKATAATANAANKVEDVKVPTSADRTKWLIAGLTVVGAIGYAVYEWRQEISLKLRQLLHR